MTRPGAHGVVALTLGVNAALLAAQAAVYFASGSQLVLAQAADSFVDLAVGVVLLVSVRVALQPRDAGHPFGHERAEPIGALVTSVLAFVLAVEVARSAAGALIGRESATIDSAVLGVLGAKLIAKGALFALILRRRGPDVDGQALSATRLDTLNDLLATASSIGGALLARAGWPSCDALLALPIAGLIAWNGWGLTRESLRYLMGEAPPEEVSRRLAAAAAACEGVVAVRRLRAHFVGSVLHVEVTVLIAAGSSAKQGHDIALDVQSALERDPVVGEVFVHIDTGEGKDGT